MSKPLILTAAAAALFAAGYWAGNAGRSSEGDRRQGGALASILSGSAAAESQGAGRAGTVEQAVRDFSPGRPFTKGQAKAWLMSLAPKLGGDSRGNATAIVELAQVFLTMDEASIMEVSTALRELADLYEAGDAALKSIPDADDLIEGATMLAMIRLSQVDPEAALETLKRFPELDDEAMLFVFGRLAADNPQRAEQMALTMEEGQRKDALEAVMYSMANKDPLSALEFAARHPGEIDDRHQQRVMEAWARREPQRATDAAVRAMEKSGNPELFRNTLEEWYKKDGTAAQEWAANLQGPAKLTAQAMFLEKHAGDDPAAALRDYAALQDSGASAEQLVRLTDTLADSLAAKDLPAARAWADTLPAGELQNRALHQVAEKWVRDDAPAASEWIRTLPDGEARDNAARTLCDAISRRDPASAFQWAQSIRQENLRRDTLGKVMEYWSEQDPDAAKAAVETLPAAEREGLR